MNCSHKTRLAFYMLLIIGFGYAAADAARADTVTFIGSRTALNSPPAVPNVERCGGPPNLLGTPSPGTGTSNFGAFTTQESFCINPITGIYSNGLFTYTFADGSTLLGTISGSRAATLNSFIFSITGGTGLFTGATGTLLGNGQQTILPGNFSNSTINFTGTITTVPEPTTLLLLGTGLAGVAAKARKRRKANRTTA